MAQYAANTTVSPEKSRTEIEHTLSRYGARQFMYGRDDDRGQAMIQFVIEGRLVRMVLPLPKRDAREFTHTEARQTERSEKAAFEKWEQACRQSWRALALVIKAKLEAVEAEISTFEQEFMANLVLPDNSTAGDSILPHLIEAQNTGKMPQALPWGGS